MHSITGIMSIRLMLLCVAVGLVSAGRSVERLTKYGKVRGFIDTLSDGDKVEKYLGIPYAKAPIGNLRFEPPMPPDPWGGVKRAQELPPACIQTQMGVDYIKMHVSNFSKISEDCLYLNLFAPKRSHYNRRHMSKSRHQYYLEDGDSSSSSSSKLSVLVYIHGGSYQNGMGAMVDGAHLASNDIIVITFNYRLGPLGFISTNDEAFPGNNGLLDQIILLKWVQENVHYFGGDPTKVTIDGHSAGGCSVGLLMLMPMAKGLFTRVIQQSGSPFAEWAVTRRPDTPNFYFKLLTSSLNCYGNGTAEVKACMQGVPESKIKQVIFAQPEHPVSLVPPFRPVVDGRILPDTPEQLAAHGEINGKEILTGTTSDEGFNAAVPLLKGYAMDRHGLEKLLAVMSCFRGDLPEVSSIMEAVLEQYFRWPYNVNDEEIRRGFVEIVGDYFISAPTQFTAEMMSARNLTVFNYHYDYRSIYAPWRGVTHGADLFYLSGYPLSGHDNFRYDDADKSMANMLMQMWSNFVKNGLPSLVPYKTFHMPPFTKTRPIYTKITSRDANVFLSIEGKFKPEKMDFWNKIVPQLYIKQLKRDQYLLQGQPDMSWSNKGGKSMRRNPGSGNRPQGGTYINQHPSSSWILIAACIGLSVLTVLLSVCYCQVRRQVSILMRQSSVNSGQTIL